MRKLLTETRLWVLIGAAGLVTTAAVVALVFAISEKVQAVPQIARDQASVTAEHKLDQNLKNGVARSRATQFSTCHRSNATHTYLNAETAKQYASDLSTYRAFAYVSGLEASTANTAPSARVVNRHAFKVRLRIERRVAATISEAAGNIKAAARGLQYLPQTNCVQLVDHPVTYTAPPPILWAEHLKQEGH